MRNDKIQKSNWGIEEHPSTELLRQYEEGILSSALSNELERHLMDCEVCDDILSGMALVDRSQTQQAKTKILQRLKTRLRKRRKKALALQGLADWRVALAVLMMFCSLGLVLFYYYTTSRSVQRAAKNVFNSGETLPPSPEELLARTIDSALVLDIQAPPPAPVYDLPAKKAGMTNEGTSEKRTVSGRVVSSGGQALAGVLVRVKGSTISTQTDTAGYFRLQLPQERKMLLFSGTGYQSREVTAATAGQPMTIRMEKL